VHDNAAIILAGGEGRRLLSLTRQLAGDDRPKQFCALLGNETLLTQTRRRAMRLVAPARTFIVVTRAHERYYRPALADAVSGTVIEQPQGRGTAPAILYGLLRQAHRAPAQAVVVLPSDHFVADDTAFMARVDVAMDVVRECPDRIVLLGIEADRPETQYGWIEPGEPILRHGGAPTYRVRRFWEKPPSSVASRLMAAGALWNSFVVVAQPAALRNLMAEAVAPLTQLMNAVDVRVGTPWESHAARAAYAQMPAVDFSRDVLQSHADRLAVMPVSSAVWDDVGEPNRAIAARARSTLDVVTA
jgi:mannose-1-phosphate guanylyltransferase